MNPRVRSHATTETWVGIRERRAGGGGGVGARPLVLIGTNDQLQRIYSFVI